MYDGLSKPGAKRQDRTIRATRCPSIHTPAPLRIQYKRLRVCAVELLSQQRQNFRSFPITKSQSCGAAVVRRQSAGSAIVFHCSVHRPSLTGPYDARCPWPHSLDVPFPRRQPLPTHGYHQTGLFPKRDVFMRFRNHID